MRGGGSGIEATIGYAAGALGSGIVYARLTSARSRHLLRVAFRVPDISRRPDRATGYAALTAVARVLRKRSASQISFVLSDPLLVEEITGRHELPDGLVLPYVGLRCVLNALPSFSVRAGPTDDLTQRARAEAALNLAA
ncbi:MAG TPA: hypothetical protein VFE35_00330 [Candidatus Cybelea sp.]|jgi:hypothetical protein|nr:hypothetical protein [Candidatus Cybelea sp.]